MESLTSCVFPILVLTYITGTYGLTCTQKDLCSCTLDDGSGDIDLSTVGSSSGSPTFSDIPGPDGFLYSLNFCYPFDEMSCSAAAGCQVQSDMSFSYQIGDASNVGFEVDTLNQVHVKYTNVDGTGLLRTTDVTLVCNPSADTPQLTVNGETAPGSVIYGFVVETKCACPNGCTDSPPPPDPTTTKGPNPPGPGPKPNSGGSSGGISIGTILCIVVLALGFSYIVGGMMYMRMVRHAQGKEMVPNVNFWGSIPGLIKDGVMFTIKKCRRGQYNKI